MKEVVYTIEDFKAKVDLSKPIHHDGWRDPIDKHGIIYRLTFRIYGVSRNGGHLLIYESHVKVSMMDISENLDFPEKVRESNSAYAKFDYWCKHLFEKFVQETAVPLGSTPGRWE